jgi:hypothetical protein
VKKEDDKQAPRTDVGLYRESPPDAPPPAPVQPTDYERKLAAEKEVAEFERNLHRGTPRQWTFLRVLVTFLAGVGIVLVLLVGLVFFTCSR